MPLSRFAGTFSSLKATAGQLATDMTLLTLLSRPSIGRPTQAVVPSRPQVSRSKVLLPAANAQLAYSRRHQPGQVRAREPSLRHGGPPVRDKSEDNSGRDSEQIRVIVHTTPEKPWRTGIWTSRKGRGRLASNCAVLSALCYRVAAQESCIASEHHQQLKEVEADPRRFGKDTPGSPSSTPSGRTSRPRPGLAGACPKTQPGSQ
jgi:hypothetical protein